ncbi:MAG: type IV pilin protein [Bradymonadia bacterium]|jgi:prepilin-type N-terminal cleavage/methylation domain-containing protein
MCKNKNNSRGFTLLELMIVVAIITLMAAVAIPAFLHYLDKAKTTEAKVNLKTLADGALNYYHQERGIPGSGGLEISTHVFPEQGEVPTIGIGDKVGFKNNPIDYAEDFNKTPWVELNFHISSPFLFSYTYTPLESPCRKFDAVAKASLANIEDSSFVLMGRSSDDGVMPFTIQEQ